MRFPLAMLLIALLSASWMTLSVAVAQEPTPTEVPEPSPTDVPAPSPTGAVVPSPTSFVAPTVVTQPTALLVCTSEAVCGSPVVVVGYTDGAQGVPKLAILVALFGFTGLIILRISEMFLLRK